MILISRILISFNSCVSNHHCFLPPQRNRHLFSLSPYQVMLICNMNKALVRTFGTPSVTPSHFIFLVRKVVCSIQLLKVIQPSFRKAAIHLVATHIKRRISVKEEFRGEIDEYHYRTSYVIRPPYCQRTSNPFQQELLTTHAREETQFVFPISTF